MSDFDHIRATGSAPSGSKGMGFLGWLTILFIALKLTGFITWSWFWVLSPMIFGFSLFVVVLILIGIIASIK